MILHHLRHNVVAYLALAVALSTGTAYAADQIASGSVTTSKLAKDAVTSSKIKKHTVKGSDLKDGDVSGTDLKDGSATGADVTDGSLGGADLAAGSLGGQHVADGTLAGVDVTDGSLTGADVLNGSIGAADLAANAAPRFAEAWAEVFNAVDPATVPEAVTDPFSFTMPRAGRVYLAYDAAYYNSNCGGGLAYAGLYVDGVALPGTGFSLPAPADPLQALHLVKVVNLPAGAREVSVGVDCPTGALGGGGRSGRTWTVLLLSD